MYTELHILKMYVGQLLTDPATYNSNIVLNHVATECERLKEFLFTAFNKAEDLSRFTNILNWYRCSLIKLADDLWAVADEGNVVTSQILILIVGLTRHTEDYYGYLLNKRQSLPAFEIQEKCRQVTYELEDIDTRLRKKNISHILLAQLLKAHTDLFRLQKFPRFCYSDEWYLNVFMSQLKSLAADDREKDWNRRLRQLLIKYNFNHMGVREVLKTEVLQDLDFIKQYKSQSSFLIGKARWLDDLEVLPGIDYNTDASDLKKALLKHIKILQKDLKQKIRVDKLSADQRFCHNHNVNRLTLGFHYGYGDGEYGYKTKKEAAEAYCRSNRARDTENISPHSIAKFDKDVLKNDAWEEYASVKRKLAKLKRDFDF